MAIAVITTSGRDDTTLTVSVNLFEDITEAQDYCAEHNYDDGRDWKYSDIVFLGYEYELGRNRLSIIHKP